MREFINIVESATQAALYVHEADQMLEKHFAGHISCTLVATNPSVVHIDYIEATVMQQGWGTKAMTALCDLADHMQITLTLEVDNNDGEEDYELDEGVNGPSDEDLINFYMNFEFEIEFSMTTRVMMVRKPKVSGA